MSKVIPAVRRTELAPHVSEQPRLTVIVSVQNGTRQLPSCLEVLHASTHTSFEMVVVGDCSTNSTPELIQRFGARYLRTPWVLGPAGARNLGTAHAAGGIVAFVDADVWVPPGALEYVASEFDCDPGLMALFGSYDVDPPRELLLAKLVGPWSC